MKEDKIIGFLYLKIFLIAVALLVIIVTFVKIGSEIVESKFKNNSFALLYVSKDTKYIFVDKNSKSVVFLSIGDVRKFVRGKSAFESSIALGMPVNAIIFDDKSKVRTINEFIESKNEMHLLLGSGTVLKNLNKYDIFKIINAMRSATGDNRKELRVNLFDQEEMKSKVGDSLKDSLINNLSFTLEIDNGTTVDGLGSNVALILSKVGYNVISVKTGTQDSNSYIAYPDGANQYTNTLEGLTNIKQKKTKVSQSADVTLYLGSDLDAMLSD